MSSHWAFSDERARCTKCGHDEAYYRYQRGTVDWEKAEAQGFVSSSDWMLRICKRCGYPWREQCADNPNPAPEKVPNQESP